MLYGAAYFTEDEWIKIDGLIHKGQYVFTRGPQNNILEEELMSFDDSIEEKAHVNVQVQANESFDTIKADTMTITERQLPSPTSSEPAESTDYPAETPIGTSAEASSDDETTHTQATEAAPMFDFSEMATPASAEQAETPKPKLSAAGGLALGYTQAQLDEVKAFNAGLTKAGKKSRPKYTKAEESYPSPEWSEGEAAPSEQTNEEGYSSPTPTEHETRIQSWASQVKTQEPSVPEIASPKPTKGGLSGAPPEAQIVVEKFVQTHGRKPKSINDLYQPNNPQFRPLDKRPLSRASNTTSKTAKSTKAIITRPSTATTATTTKASNLPDPRLKPGKIFIAQRAFEKKSNINIEVRPGDNIKIIKHVSGITHLGQNLNTNQTGQFPESIFTLAAGATSVTAKQDSLIEHQRALAAAKQTQVALRQRVQSVSTVSGLDRVEGMNAAEWEDVSVVSRARVTPTPAPVKKSLGGGLSASRYAVLADEEEPPAKKGQEVLSGMSKEEVSRLVDEKVDIHFPSSHPSDNTNSEQFAQILAAQAATTAANASAVPIGPRTKPPIKEPLKPVNPKTNTCWFWATPNKDCRFTADECRDLHAFLPSLPSDPTNLRMGKPTWGALADSLPTASSITSSSTEIVEYKPGKASKTCWYWAQDGKCQNSADSCKYLHEHCAAGVAQRPNTWKRINWSRWGNEKKDGENGDENETEENGNGSGGSYSWGDETSFAEEGELVLEEVQGNDSWGTEGDSVSAGWGNGWGNAEHSGGWGESSGEKYKPPHIKALEEKAQIEAIGW